MGAVAQFTNKLKISKPTVSFWRCKKSETSLQEFVWIVPWINYLHDSLLWTDSGYIPNNTHLSFLTRVMFGKSPNNIPFVLRHNFTLLTRRSSLSVSIRKKKHETDSPSTSRSHPCYSSWDMKRRNMCISNCLELLLASFVVVLVSRKKQTTSRDDANVYSSNVLVRTLSSVSSKTFKANPDKRSCNVLVIVLVMCRFELRTI